MSRFRATSDKMTVDKASLWISAANEDPPLARPFLNLVPAKSTLTLPGLEETSSSYIGTQ